MQTKSVYAAMFYANCQMQAGLQWKYKFICAPHLIRQNHNKNIPRVRNCTDTSISNPTFVMIKATGLVMFLVLVRGRLCDRSWGLF